MRRRRLPCKVPNKFMPYPTTHSLTRALTPATEGETVWYSMNPCVCHSQSSPIFGATPHFLKMHRQLSLAAAWSRASLQMGLSRGVQMQANTLILRDWVSAAAS